MKSNFLKIGKRLLLTLWLPIGIYVFFALLTAANGKTGFGVGSDWMVITRNTVYTGLIALALSFNLTSGRLDFSIGSVLILSTIVGVNITLGLDFGPLGLVIVCMIVGALLGVASGLTYIILRLPPIVVSVGVAMIYEALGFIVNEGRGVRLIGNMSLLVFAQQPYLTLLIVAVLAILIIVVNFTKFGYDSNSLRGGQAIAVNIGINEKRNTVIAYLIAGALMAAAGVINLSILGTMSPKLGLSSFTYILNAFLPMFIGGYLGRFSERSIGILIGAFIQACIISGFTNLGLSPSLQTILNSVIVLVFLLFTGNSYKLVELQMLREKRQKALAAVGND